MGTETAAGVVALFNDLNREQKTEAAEALHDEVDSILGSKSQWVSNTLWIMLFIILGGVIFAGGWLAIQKGGSDETALYGFVGIALGALAGLLAPSPTNK